MYVNEIQFRKCALKRFKQEFLVSVLVPVAIGAALEADLAQSQHNEEAHMPGDQPQPAVRNTVSVTPSKQLKQNHD